MKKILFLASALFLSSMRLFSQEKVATAPLPLFQSNDILKLTIKTDLKSLLRDVGDEREEHPGTVEYVHEGDTVRLLTMLRTRGKFRRDPKNCSFPPLRLNFKKKQTVNTIFEGTDKMKLVTHCKSNINSYQKYIVREYLVYRIFNLLSDTSYRARLTEITYIDDSGKMKPQTSLAILVEPDEAIEDRLNCKKSDRKYMLPDSTNFWYIGMVSMFQYMIGNTDWAVTTQHNIQLFDIVTGEPPHAIPYDFDWCGVVNSHYAVPLPRFGTKTVRERVYRGQCRPFDQFQEYANFFESKKSDIYQLINNYPLLSKSEKRDIIGYLEEFYYLINNERLIRSKLMIECL